jgi:hypothetical protein
MAIAMGTLLIGGASNADAPPGRYTIITTNTIAGGAVADTRTGLTWQRTVPVSTYTWNQAVAYCPTLGTGWRTPSIKELMTIVDFTKAMPAIDVAAFPGTPSERFWSSSMWVGAASSAWNVDFSEGKTKSSDAGSQLTFANRVRCVR